MRSCADHRGPGEWLGLRQQTPFQSTGSQPKGTWVSPCCLHPGFQPQRVSDPKEQERLETWGSERLGVLTGGCHTPLSPGCFPDFAELAKSVSPSVSHSRTSAPH